MNTDTDAMLLPAVARQEADRMRSAVAGRADDAAIRMSAAQFRTLASLIERLAEQCGEGPCWLDEGAGARVWVPLAHLERAQRELAASRTEVAEVRAQLESCRADRDQILPLAFGFRSVA